jgi:hypothetical protein
LTSLLTAKNAPHLVLGVPSSATNDECLKGFALRSRRVKNNPDSHFSIHDLTSALAEIENTSREEALALRYEIPCDLSVYDPNSSFFLDGIEYSATSDLSDLELNQLDEDARETASTVLLASAIHQTLEWNWTQSGQLARECLRISRDESERDEALNILAVSLVMTGDSSKAIDALKKAVEGDWNLPLQKNLAILAIEEDPSLAISQMSHLVDGADTPQERLQATRYAMRLWRMSQGEETSSDDEDDYEPLPEELLESIYQLIYEPGIHEEDFFEIGMFLARVDSVGIEISGVIDTGHFANTPSAQMIALRIAGFDEFIEGMGRIAKNDPQKLRPWIHENIDSFVTHINSQLLDKEESGFADALAFAMLTNELDATTFPRVAMRLLLVRRLHKVVELGTHPSDKFIDWMDEATKAIENQEVEIQEELIDFVATLRESAGNVVAIVFHQALVAQGKNIERAATQISLKLRSIFSRMSVDRDSLHDLAKKIVQACDEALGTYRRIIRYSTLDDTRKDMESVSRSYQKIKESMSRY